VLALTAGRPPLPDPGAVLECRRAGSVGPVVDAAQDGGAVIVAEDQHA